jgi:hypothetical protein
VVCFALVAAAGGCYAHRVPRVGVLAADAQLLAAGPLPYTVSIAPWNAEPGAEEGTQAAATLADLVTESSAFTASRLASAQGGATDLVAVPLGLDCRTSIVPVFTILTAGIVPTLFEDGRCDGLILRSPVPGSGPPIEIRVAAKEQVVVGWAAAVVGALRGWAYGRLDADRAYADALHLEIAKRRSEIEALVKSGAEAAAAAAAAAAREAAPTPESSQALPADPTPGPGGTSTSRPPRGDATR